MKIYSWVFWRLAWLSQPSDYWHVTVYDHKGRWRKVVGRLCVLVERAK